MGDRGVVLTPKIDLVPSGIRTSSLDFIEGHLRQAAVYWDKIDVPTSNAIDFGRSSSMNELAAAGVLQQTHVPHTHGSMTSASVISHAMGTPFVAFERLSAEDPGAWSIMRTGSAFVLPDELAQKTRSVEIALYNLLPVPAPDVPIDKILAFKSKRADELARFRASTDDLYQKVRNARDGARAFESAADEIRAAVADTFFVMNESFSTRLLSAARVELTAEHLSNAVRAGLAAAALGWRGVLGSAVGALTPAIKIGRSAGKAPKGNIGGAPFAYVHDVMRDLLP
jgi:hypothetical protein